MGLQPSLPGDMFRAAMTIIDARTDPAWDEARRWPKRFRRQEDARQAKMAMWACPLRALD